MEERLQKASLQEILSGAIGLCFGLVVAGLIILALPVTRLSGMIGNISAIVILLMSVGLSVAVALRKREELLSLLNYGRNNERNILGAKPVNAAKDRPAYKVLDTSSIIDGRIAVCARLDSSRACWLYPALSWLSCSGLPILRIR